jgi:hypothetical protein
LWNYMYVKTLIWRYLTIWHITEIKIFKTTKVQNLFNIQSEKLHYKIEFILFSYNNLNPAKFAFSF